MTHSLHNGPYWIPEVVCFVDSLLTKDSLVFEYGAGGSTLWFQSRVAHIYSVEHNKRWYRRIVKLLPKEKSTLSYKPLADIKKYKRRCMQGQPFLSKEQEPLEWNQYINTIKEFPDHYFDFVCIDGRLRRRCLLASIPKVKAGGWLMLDDYNRGIYSCVVGELGKSKTSCCFTAIDGKSSALWHM